MTITLALMLNELATNAAKYSALSTDAAPGRGPWTILPPDASGDGPIVDSFGKSAMDRRWSADAPRLRLAAAGGQRPADQGRARGTVRARRLPCPHPLPGAGGVERDGSSCPQTSASDDRAIIRFGPEFPSVIVFPVPWTLRNHAICLDIPDAGQYLALSRYDVACRALAEAKAVDDIVEIVGQANAVHTYPRQAKNRQMEIDAAEIRIRAQRRLGELMAAQKT